MPITAKEVLDQEWTFSRIVDVSGGLNVRTPTEALEDPESPDLENVRFSRSRIETSHGYRELTDSFLGDRPIPIQFPRVNGDIDQLMLTDTTLYIRESGEWHLASYFPATTTGASISAGANRVWVNDIPAALNAGDTIEVIPTENSPNQTRFFAIVVSKQGNIVTVDRALPGAGIIRGGSVVRFGIGLSGSEEHYPSWDVMPSADMLVITNGSDTPFRYTTTLGDGEQPVAEVPGLIAAFTAFLANDVIVWKNHLIFLDTTENGIRYPYRVRRSGAAAPGEWTEGLSGKTDLLDSPSPILKALRLGPYLIIYRLNSAIRAEYLGSGARLIDFDTVIEGPGPVSKTAVTSLDSYHILVSTYGIHLYQGLLESNDIGSKVDLRIFPPDGPLTADVYNKVRICRVEQARTIYIIVPNGEGGSTAFFSYLTEAQDSVVTPHWSIREISFPVEAVGEIIEDNTGSRWSDYEDTMWDTFTAVWRGGAISGRVSTVTLTDDENNVYLFGQQYAMDGDDAIDWFYQTRLFSLDDRDMRLDSVVICYMGDAFTPKYRLDNTSGFTPFLDKFGKEVELPNNPSGRANTVWTRQQKVCRDIELRFEGTGNTQIIWYGFRFKQESRGFPEQASVG